MPRFILIDHSILDTTGHHYEYAVRVLEAAEGAGYQPVLAVNTKFQTSEKVSWPVLRLYRIGFWPRMGVTAGSQLTSNLLAKAFRSLGLIRARLFFSRLGFLWLIRSGPLAYLKWHPFDSPVSSPFLVIGGTIYLLFTLPAYLLWALMPAKAYFAGVARTVFRLGRTSLLQALDSISPSGSLAHWRFARRKERDFAKATARLLRSVELDSDDIVFIPTLAEPEMLGLLECFRGQPNAAVPSYHLLFRRNLYNGREPDFDSQDAGILPVRNAFLQFVADSSNQRVYFYTDTEELSAQFNRLKIRPFRTCPIPHTVPAAEHLPPSQPLRITYLGDARAEKGYHYLPAVVQDFRRELGSGKVCFVFQSNYNVLPGEPEAVIARSQLSRYPPEQVELHTSTLSSAQYRKLLLSADIMLLPYREDLYYARSSGVLIEALAAGIPVVAPATSWLAKQFMDPAYRYLSTVSDTASLLRAKRYHWILEGSHAPRFSSGEVLRIGGEGHKAYAWVTIPPGASYTLIRLGFDEGPGQFITCYISQVDDAGDTVDFSLYRLGRGYQELTGGLLVSLVPSARRIWVAFRNAFSDQAMSVRQPSIEFLKPRFGQSSIPMSSVGTTFTDNSPRAISAALREIVMHFDHYRESARAFSEQVYTFHNAANVVETLAASASHLREERVQEWAIST